MGVASRTAQSNYKRLIQVLVIGSDGDHCPKATYDAAKEVGAQIAARSAVTITGGLGGVMEAAGRSEEHTSELQSQSNLVCRLLLEKKKKRDDKPSPRAHSAADATTALAMKQYTES